MPAGVVSREANIRKEMERFVKNFVGRSAQVIVLSRAEGANQYRTCCRTYSGNGDWFLLNIQENEEVSAQLLNIWKQCDYKSIPVGSSICLEMSMVTTSNERVVLEVWEFAILPETDGSGRQTYDIYCRMGILLKSLITVSRVMPAYRLASNQGDQTYRLHYEMYLGPMILQDPAIMNEKCGENATTFHVGNIPLVYGTFSVSVRYRTKLVLGSKEKLHDTNGMTWRSDYFAKTDLDSQNLIEKCGDITKSIEVPRSRNGKFNKQLNECSPYGAFAEQKQRPIKEEPEDLCDMFYTLLLEPDEMIPEDINEKSCEQSDDEKDTDLYDETPKQMNEISNKEQFVMVDLKPAFADCSSDLGIFFSGAPPVLKSLQIESHDEEVAIEESKERDTLQKQVEEMNKQLENLESVEHFFAGVLNEVET